jgi:AtzE family amidohydrolase
MSVQTEDAVAIAGAVRAGRARARDLVARALEQIEKRDGEINAFTAVTAEAALKDAERLDAAVAAGRDPGPLAGVPFAVKNLFDIGGLVTLAGSKINRDRPAAARDAAAVRALKGAGAVLVGALNMEEYALGFVTENAHYGPTRNPHDLSRIAGGSSGGSAAAVAAGLVPISLGTDTGGSVRVPAALCGIFGMKPTFGRISRVGTAFLAPSMDHVGSFARSARDLAAVFDALQGPDPEDPACSERPPELSLPGLRRGVGDLRIAVADGYFAQGATPEALAVVGQAAQALGATRRVAIPEAHRARAAAMLTSASEGANLRLPDLRTRARDFDPITRDRFLAGALIPVSWYLQAQRFRAWFQDAVREIFRREDILLAPTTPYEAIRIGQEKITVNGTEVAARPTLGLYTFPFSFIGVPVVSAPIRRAAGLPLGVQIVGAPFRDGDVLRVAAALEAAGVAAAAQ